MDLCACVSVCAHVVRVAGCVQRHVCGACVTPCGVCVWVCGRADVVVWLWACCFSAHRVQDAAAQSLWVGQGVQWPGSLARRTWLRLIPCGPQNGRLSLLPVPIFPPHAIPTGQALPRTKPCSCLVWGSQSLIGWHLVEDHPCPISHLVK